MFGIKTIKYFLGNINFFIVSLILKGIVCEFSIYLMVVTSKEKII